MFTKKTITFVYLPFLLVLVMVFSCVFAFPASAAEFVDDLDLVDYISDIVVLGDDVAHVTYKIPTDPYAMWYGSKPGTHNELIGTGSIVGFNQDITTNTYQEYNLVLNMGTFSTKYSNNDAAYFYTSTFSDSVAFRSITHMFLDGVLYELRLVESDARLILRPMGDVDSFVSCQLYIESMANNPVNTLRVWFDEPGDHTLNFGYLTDVTETVREYYSLFGNIRPLGKVGDSVRVIDVSDLKAGSNFDISFSYDYLLQTTGTSGEFSPYIYAHFYDEDFNSIGQSEEFRFDLDSLTDNRIYGTHSATITVPEGAAYFLFNFVLPSINVQECRMLQFLVKDLEISCLTTSLDANSKSLSVIQNKIDKVQQSIQDANDKLDDVNQGIQDTNDKLDDVNQGIQDTNDKLEDVNQGIQDTNDKLDELPGQIGDEFQGILDSEKEQASQTGDKYVDQILGILPDSSTEIMAALNSLTVSMSYTGTEAVIPIPAVVLPGIDGLIPRTQIWGGMDFDFGEYVEMLPANLLSLVRNLFTIAIVLFCAYELKGIISYCLTLKESKGG